MSDTIRIGDLTVHRLGFGAMRLPGKDVWGEPADPERARRVLRRAVELGINLIDTAWYYGPHVSNRLIAEALHPYPKDLVIATKLGGKRLPDKGWAGAARPEELKQGMEDDLRTLKRDHIDVVHFRYVGPEVPFLESLDALIAMRKEGKLRHIGLSCVTVPLIEQALARTPIVTVQNMYSAAGGVEQLARFTHSEVEGAEAVLDLCAARGIAFLPFFPLGAQMGTHGPLATIAKRHGATPMQVAIRWLLARSKVMLPIPGTGSPEHLEENWAAQKLELSPQEVAEIAAAR
jgi:aryl-alcohol dehydrogenase-like predicted oxidoreductase